MFFREAVHSESTTPHSISPGDISSSVDSQTQLLLDGLDWHNWLLNSEPFTLNWTNNNF